jgi:hypothetical protein
VSECDLGTLTVGRLDLLGLSSLKRKYTDDRNDVQEITKFQVLLVYSSLFLFACKIYGVLTSY